MSVYLRLAAHRSTSIVIVIYTKRHDFIVDSVYGSLTVCFMSCASPPYFSGSPHTADGVSCKKIRA